MPRPKIDLDAYKDWMIEEYQNHATVQSILDVLHYQHSVNISRVLFYARLKEWGVQRHQVRTQQTQSLNERLSHLYYEYGLSDDAICRDLRQAGFQISLSGVATIRRSLEIYRRMPVDLVHERQQQLRAFFTLEKETEGVTRRLGRSTLYTHMRQRQFNLSRDAIFQVYREFHEDAIHARLHQAQRRRGVQSTPGPNYMWSIDAHLKLSHFGFDIYAAIDAYSRFITWFYVGCPALTERGILAQYLDTVKGYDFIPQVVRTDKGNETMMAAAAHYMLSQSAKTNRFPRQIHQGDRDDRANEGPEGPLPWSSCWSYGKPTRNQRIENWWNQQQKHRTVFWKDFFSMLETTGLWDKDTPEDRIALLFIYMPVLRYETSEFVRLWNGHRIGHQRRRPHIVSGIPYQLFTMPNPAKGYVDCRGPLDSETWDELTRIAETDSVDLEAYLPASTHKICETLSRPYSERLSTNPSFQDESPFLREYERLRQDLRRYILSRQEPVLEEFVKPRRTWEELQRMLRERNLSLDGLNHLQQDDEVDDAP